MFYVYLLIFWIVLVAGNGQEKEECEYANGDQCPYDAVPDKACEVDQEGPSSRLTGRDVDFVDSLQHSYIVSLQTLKCGNHALGTGCYEHFCGGTMIAQNLILTAAHCFDKLKSRQTRSKLNGQQYYTPKEAIYAAVNPLCRHFGNGQYGRFEVNSIFIHPQYQQPQAAWNRVPLNDVAILEIFRQDGKFYQGPLVQFVGEEFEEDINDAKVLGYGQAQPEHVQKYIAYPLHAAQLERLTLEECQLFLKFQDDRSTSQLNYTNMVCYYNDRADACNGDSGGPLLSNKGTQIGLVSWGPGTDCLSIDALQAPGVYTRLTLFANWIQQIINDFAYQVVTTPSSERTLSPGPELTPPIISQPIPSPTPEPTPTLTPSPALVSKPAPTPTPTTNSIAKLEANALLAFKNNMQDNQLLSSWKGSNACKDWVGISCKNNRVVDISLGDSDWNISEPSQSKSQSQLVKNVQTSIPQQWSVMDNLQRIQLGEIGLTGFLPIELSNIKTLKVLDVDEANIQGTLPPHYSTLVSLVVLDCELNDLTGTLPPQFSTLKSLVWIEVSSNSLTGMLPPQYSQLTSLKELWLYSNFLTGTLPPQYSQLTSLDDLSASSNSLTGTLPQQYSELVNLDMLLLENNKLAGIVPSEYTQIGSSPLILLFPQDGDSLCLERNYESIVDGNGTVYC